MGRKGRWGNNDVEAVITATFQINTCSRLVNTSSLKVRLKETKKRRKVSAQTLACSPWPGINHMLESWAESILGEAWGLRLGEGMENQDAYP